MFANEERTPIRGTTLPSASRQVSSSSTPKNITRTPLKTTLMKKYRFPLESDIDFEQLEIKLEHDAVVREEVVCVIINISVKN